MLPSTYFHATITVPGELRPTLRSNQRDGYSALIKAAAEAIIELARDRSFVGGTVLPKGFHKLRYFGLWHPANHHLTARARLMLLLDQPAPPGTAAEMPTSHQPKRY
jgi:hypothetical protein